MTARFHSRNGQRVERLGRLSQPPRFHTAGGRPASARYGDRFGSLPVHGSRAWRDRQPLLSRIFTR